MNDKQQSAQILAVHLNGKVNKGNGSRKYLTLVNISRFFQNVLPFPLMPDQDKYFATSK